MADWQREIEIELRRAGESQNPGRLRTAARRIAGIAIQQLPRQNAQSPAERDYITALRVFIKSEKLPIQVAAAAARLEARLSVDFTSQSLDPIRDAMLIVEFVRKKLQSSEKNETGSHNPD
jgi:hypothetical protein